MRRLRNLTLAVVPALVVALAGILSPGMARAAFAGYAASDVLGQLDGSGNPDFTTNTSGTSATTFDYPDGSGLDTVHHRLFVGECGNNRVTVFNLDSDNNLIDRTADYVLGQPDFTSSTSATTQSGMGCPYLGVEYDLPGNRLFVTGDGPQRVLVYDFSNGISNGMNASYVLGQPDFTSNNTATTQNGTSDAEGITYDSVNKRLFVGDYSNNRILVFDLSNGISNGMNASYVLGQPDFTSSSSNLTQNGFERTEALAYDNVHQRLFVDDYRNKRVLIFEFSGGISNNMNASYVLGQPDFTTATANLSQSGMNCPQSIGYDPLNQQLFAGDCSYNRILIFDLSNGITNNMNAVAVLGQPDFTTSTSNTTQTGMQDPEGQMSFDPAHRRLFALDSSNNRVMIFNLAKLASELNDPAVGDSYSQWMGSQFQGTPTFSVVAGSLPPGLTLDASSGLLSGVFTQAGTFNFTIQLVDDLGTAGSITDTHSYSLVVDPAVAVAGAATLSNTGLSVGVGSGLGITLIGSATFIYRKRNHLYRLWGWEP